MVTKSVPHQSIQCFLLYYTNGNVRGKNGIVHQYFGSVAWNIAGVAELRRRSGYAVPPEATIATRQLSSNAGSLPWNASWTIMTEAETSLAVCSIFVCFAFLTDCSRLVETNFRIQKSINMSSQIHFSTFPQIRSNINSKLPAFKENSEKWEEIIQNFEKASVEASLESISAGAIEKHTAQQILGK